MSESTVDVSTEKIAAIGKEFLQMSLEHASGEAYGEDIDTKMEKSAALRELHEYADDLRDMQAIIQLLHERFEDTRREESSGESTEEGDGQADGNVETKLYEHMAKWSAPALAELFELMAKGVEFINQWTESGLIYLCIRDPFNLHGWELQKTVAKRIKTIFEDIRKINAQLSSFVDEDETLRMDMLYLPEGWEVKQGVGKYAAYKYVMLDGDDSKAFWLKRL